MTLKADAQPLTKEIERAQKSIKNTTDQLRRESDTFGMTRKEIALYDASMKGATKSQLAMIASLHDEIEAKKKAAEATKAAIEAQKNKGFKAFVRNTVSGFSQIGLAANGLRTAFGAIAKPLELAQTQLVAERKLEQVFKTTGNAAGIAADEIKKFAAERQNLTNFGDEATIDAAAILGSFTNIKGNIFTEALVSAQDLSAFMGKDLQSSIIQIGKALNDPARGVSALAESGIQFSKAQMEQIKALQETGKVAEAQAIIMKELQTQFGGQAQALVDPIQQMSNAWGDSLEELGKGFRDAILPVMPDLIKAFGELGKGIKGTVEFLTESIDRMQQLAFMVTALGSGMSLQDAQAAYNDFAGLKANDAGVGGIAGALKIGMQKKAEQEQLKVEADAAVQTKKDEAAGVMQAEKVLAGFVRDGLSGLTSAYMGLGPAAKPGITTTNQVGSLEKGSQAAMDVIRANTGQASKDDIAKKQLETQQKMEKHMQQMAKQFGLEWTPGFKIWNIES